MAKNRKYPLLSLIILLLATGLACQALTTLPDSAVQVDTDAIVAAAVATIEAELPTETQSAASNTTGVAEPSITNSQLTPISGSLQEKLIDVYAKVNPAVVHIFVFEDVQDTAIPLGSGSGFVFSEEGHIVTNNHVVTDGQHYEVMFADSSRRSAELVGTDVDSDLGVIKVETLPEGVKPIALSDSKDLQVGQFVIAIGNPFGETGSMSIGIISGLGRTLESQRIAEGGGRYTLPQVIQTDAAINPGNSGGPLLNLNGEVVGVNSAIQTLTGTNSGVGFSIPVNAVRRIIPTLIRDGRYVYPFIGIRMISSNLEQTEQLIDPQISGVLVTDVTAGTPAAEAGLIGSTNASGDLIIAIDGQQVATTDELISHLVFETEVGQTVDLTVLRDGQEVVIPLTLGERP